MSNKKLATYKGHCVMINGKKDIFQQTLAIMSPTVKVTNAQISGTGNQRTLQFDVTYGPVKGAWPSDILKKVKTAMSRAGCSAMVTLVNGQRTVLE